jgi:DNA-binding LytR/AlgR family response regulator
MAPPLRVLIVDDEPLARSRARRMLEEIGGAEVVGEAASVAEARERIAASRPDLLLLDIRMPHEDGFALLEGLEPRPAVIFVTAYDHYAVQAFAQGVLDYLVKPVESARLAETVARLKERMGAARPATNTEALLRQLTEQLAKLQGAAGAEPLRWIRAQVGRTLRLISTDDIAYLRADSKYTLIAWRGDDGTPAEAIVRTPLKDLATQLDAAQFVQVHRSAIVNLRAIDHVRRGDNETADIHLKGRPEILPVSRNFLHLFKQM